MAWTTPRTWVSGELVTAAIMNSAVRDNLAILKTPINDSGELEFTDATELTIAAGVITVTQNYHKVDTQSDAATDDLDTITAGTDVAAGFVLHLRVESAARTVVIKDGTGGADNLDIGTDVTLDESYKTYSLVYDGSNWRPWTFAEAATSPNINEGRLTLTSGTAVTTADVTGAGTVYFALDRGDKVSLYDGSAKWEVVTFAEMSIALSGGTASRPNDIFLDYNGGSPVLTILAWTNDTTRATAIVKQNGVWCKTGDLQQRYLGTVYLDASQQCEDSQRVRHCFNLSNQRVRPLHRVDGTTSWTYTSSSYRQADGDSDNQLDIMLGVDQSVNIHITATSSSNSDARWRTTAIGLDGLTVTGLGSQVTETGGESGNTQAFYSNFPGVGRRYFIWMERSSAGGTTTFYGNDTYRPSGMGGFVMG